MKEDHVSTDTVGAEHVFEQIFTERGLDFGRAYGYMLLGVDDDGCWK